MIFSYIILFLFGVLIGNFSTTIFFRLPRDIMICGIDRSSTKPPFCSNCRHILQYYEYLPILSWFSTLGKCNYCYINIDKSYIILELLGGLTAIILYFLLGNNLEYFFLYFCFAVLMFLNIFIYLKHNFIPIILTTILVALGIIFRTLIDHSIFPWLTNLSFAFIGSLWIIRNSINKKKFPNYHLVNLLIPACVWCNYNMILVYSIISIFWYLIEIIIEKKIFYSAGIVSLFFTSLYSLIILDKFI